MSLVNSVELAKALQIHENRVSGTSTKIADALVKTRLRKGSFDKVFPTMFSIHYKDLYSILLREQKLGTMTQSQMRAVEEAFALTIEELSFLEKATPAFMSKVISDIDEYIALMNSSIVSGTIHSKSWNSLDNALAKIRNNFKTPKVVYYVPNTSESIGSIKLIYDSFQNLRQKVNTIFKKHLSQQVDDNNELIVPDYENIAKDIFNFGHTVTEGTNSSTFLTGKLLAEILSTANTNLIKEEGILDTLQIDFIQQTDQIKTKIVMHQGITKDEQGVFNLIIDSGYFQTARYQHVQENQNELAAKEAAWSITEASGRLNLLSALGCSSLSDLASKLLKVRSSPSLLDKINAKIVSAISGNKVDIDTSVIVKTLLDKTTNITKVIPKVSIKNTKSIPSTPRLRTTKGQFTSLTSLQVLINRKLAEQIQRNMGSGFSKSVLNYRTGRFASSAHVERLTISQQGMITAFYSYMKNPYQTFEPGYAQGSPQSRDPKLLISKSIREIAAKSIGNRMRAVSV